MRVRARLLFGAMVVCGGAFFTSGAPAAAAEDTRVGGAAVNGGPFTTAVPACRRMQLTLAMPAVRPPGRFGLPLAERTGAAKPLYARFFHAAQDGRMAFAGSTRGYGGFSVQTIVRWHIEGTPR